MAGGRGSHLGCDDHGGSLKALIVSGSVGLMKNEDIDTVSYFQVDNSLIHCLGPTFLGYRIPGESQMSSKTIPRHAIARALWLQAHLSLKPRHWKSLHLSRMQQSKILPHFPMPPRSLMLAIGSAVRGLMRDGLNLRFLRLLQPYLRSLANAGIAAEKG